VRAYLEKNGGNFFNWPLRYDAGFIKDCENFQDNGNATNWDTWVATMPSLWRMVDAKKKQAERKKERKATQLEDLEGKDERLETDTQHVDGNPEDTGENREAATSSADGTPRRFPFRFSPR